MMMNDENKLEQNELQNTEQEQPQDEYQPQAAAAASKLSTRSAPSAATTFNKKFVALLLGVVGIFVVLALFTSFNSTPQAPSTAEMVKGDFNPETFDVTELPDEIEGIPDNYAELQNENIPQLYPENPITGDTINTGYSPANPQLSTLDGQAVRGNETEQELIKQARQSPIRIKSSGSQNVSSYSQPTNDTALLAAAIAAQQNNNSNSSQPVIPGLMPTDPNGQADKIKFLQNAENTTAKFYSGNSLKAAVSKTEVKAGTVIPGVMITGLNSDLPGQIIGQVSQNVFDSITGKYLLIPQGTKILGMYDSKIMFGQNRVLVVWNRLIFPNGKSLDLGGLGGVDLQGFAGLKDKTNSHYFKMLGAVLLSSVISWGAEEATEDMSDENTVKEALQQNAVAIGGKILDKHMGIQPTITIRQGYRFNIMVSKDFVLEKYQSR